MWATEGARLSTGAKVVLRVSSPYRLQLGERGSGMSVDVAKSYYQPLTSCILLPSSSSAFAGG